MQMPRRQPGCERRVLWGNRRLDDLVRQADQVAEQGHEQQRNQPGREEPLRQQAPGQGGGERQYRGDLTARRDGPGTGTEQVADQVDHDRRDQHRGDQVEVAQEAAGGQPGTPAGQEHAHHVQQHEGGTDPHAQPEEVGAAEEQQPFDGEGQVAGQEAASGEHRDGSTDEKPAMGVDDGHRQRGRQRPGEGGAAEGQLVPLRFQRPPLDHHRLVDADRADQRERKNPDVEHQHVGYLGPAEERPGDNGDVPARPGPVQDQPDHHHGHRRADVVR